MAYGYETEEDVAPAYGVNPGDLPLRPPNRRQIPLSMPPPSPESVANQPRSGVDAQPIPPQMGQMAPAGDLGILSAPNAPPPVNPRIAPPAPMGPAAQRLQDFSATPPPEIKPLHGWKRVLDTIGQIAAPRVEEAIRNEPQRAYAGQLSQLEKGATAEEQAAKEPLTLGQEVATSRQKNALADQEEAKAAQLRNPAPKPATNDFERWIQQNPDAPVSDWLNLQNTTRQPTNDFELFIKQNPNAKASDYLAMQAENQRTGAVKPEIVAQIGERPIKPGEKNSKGLTDEQWGKKSQQITQDESIASADARGKSYGRNRPVQVLDTFNGNRPVTVSAGEAEDNPQRYVTQSGGEKALPREALIGDIRTSAQNVRKNLDVLNATGFDRAKLAAALGDPSTTFQAYLQAIPRGSLDDRGQQFVSDLFNLREQAMAMRSVLGAGAGSEDMRRAILQTLPGVATPGQGFGEKQIDNLLAVLDRLERGVPNVPLTNRQGQSGAPGSSAPAPAKNDPLGIR